MSQIEVKEESENEYSIMLNLGQYLNSRQIQKIEEVIQKTYDKGHADGYKDASKGATQIISILCKRQSDNTIEISDEELRDCNGKLVKERWTDELGSIFRWEDD